MRIGIVSKWFDRGQPVVGRYLRSAFEDLGHETFVLARPKKQRGPRPGALDRRTSGPSPGSPRPPSTSSRSTSTAPGSRPSASTPSSATRTTSSTSWPRCGARASTPSAASSGSTSADEHVAGAQRGLRARLLDDPRRAGALRATGASTRPGSSGASTPSTAIAYIRPTGRDASEVGRSIYHAGLSASASRSRRSSRLHAHARPELAPDGQGPDRAQAARLRRGDGRRGRPDRAGPRRPAAPRAPAAVSPSCDVCIAPSRWEGLGLPSTRRPPSGMPIVCNDDPPMNELVTDGVNGLLVAAIDDGSANSGIPALLRRRRRARQGLRPARRPGAARAARRGLAAQARGAHLVAHRRRVSATSSSACQPTRPS